MMRGTRRHPGFLAVLLLVGCHGKYVRPVSDDPIPATPERLSRGSYLVNQVLACGACHTGRANGNVLTDPERPDAFLAGGNRYAAGSMGTLWVANITADPETGVGRWKDDELLRLLRDGVARDGRFLLPAMPFAAYQHLSDDDARAVVTYLRTVPPHRQEKPPIANDLSFMAKLMFKAVGVQMHEPIAGVTAPDPANRLEHGRYLVRIAACGECHSRGQKGPRAENDPLYLAGSDVPFEDAGLGKVYARNLASDPETGLGRFDAVAIKQAIRSGSRLDGKRMAAPMSTLTRHYSAMTDADLDAIVTFLKSLPPARNRIPERKLVEAVGHAGEDRTMTAEQ
jgi:mono/diheme cytochrome c family protein